MNNAPTLLQTIQAYRGASETFEHYDSNNDDDSILAAQTYMPHLIALERWQHMATSEIEAREAIRLAEEFAETYEDSLASQNLMNIGKRYLDTRPKLTLVKG